MDNNNSYNIVKKFDSKYKRSRLKLLISLLVLIIPSILNHQIIKSLGPTITYLIISAVIIAMLYNLFKFHQEYKINKACYEVRNLQSDPKLLSKILSRINKLIIDNKSSNDTKIKEEDKLLLTSLLCYFPIDFQQHIGNTGEISFIKGNSDAISKIQKIEEEDKLLLTSLICYFSIDFQQHIGNTDEISFIKGNSDAISNIKKSMI